MVLNPVEVEDESSSLKIHADQKFNKTSAPVRCRKRVDKESSNGKKGYVAVDSCGINAGTFENGISSVQADHFHDVRLVADFCIPLIHVLSNLKSNV